MQNRCRGDSTSDTSEKRSCTNDQLHTDANPARIHPAFTSSLISLKTFQGALGGILHSDHRNGCASTKHSIITRSHAASTRRFHYSVAQVTARCTSSPHGGNTCSSWRKTFYICDTLMPAANKNNGSMPFRGFSRGIFPNASL